MKLQGNKKASVVFLSMCLMIALITSLLCNDQKEKSTGMTCHVSYISRNDLIKPADLQQDLQVQKKSRKKQKKRATKAAHSVQNVHKQYEAQFSDIAIPLMVSPFEVSTGEKNSVLLVYHCLLSVKEIISFYRQEMERLGWRQELQFEGQEIVLVFKKPGRYCVVSLRPTYKTFERSKKILLSIFIGSA